MGLRLRLSLILFGTLGASFALSSFFLVQLEIEAGFSRATGRVEALMEAVAPATANWLAEGRASDIAALMDGLELRGEVFALQDLWILDAGGAVFYSLRDEQGRLPDKAFVQRAVAARDSVTAKGADRSSGRVSMPLQTGGRRVGTMIGELSPEIVRERVTNRLVRILVGVVLVSLIGFLVAWGVLSRFVIRPLTELFSLAESWRQGDFSPRAPVRYGGEIGVLADVMNAAADAIEKNRETLEEEVRRRTAELEEANARLEHLALTDGLTGLYNHRHFQEVLAQEITRQSRARRPFGLVMCDVDHFKNYNDTHGHPAGDVVLRELSRLFLDNIRSSDVVARYGGEEFVILFIESTRADARARADQLRALIAAHDFPHKDEQPLGCVSVSMGLAMWPDDGASAETLLKAADEALYESKRHGRNRVTDARHADGAPA